MTSNNGLHWLMTSVPTADTASWGLWHSSSGGGLHQKYLATHFWDGRATSSGGGGSCDSSHDSSSSSSSSSNSVASRFPRDLVLAIFRMLDPRILGVCSGVCREWAALCWHPRLWMWKCQDICRYRFDGRVGRMAEHFFSL